MAAPVWLTELIVRSIIRKIKEKRMNKILKGKLTYSALGALFTAVATQVLGDGVVTADDWKELGEAVMILVAIYGRFRATRA